MVNKLCFVDGCQTRSDQENGPASFFRPPKDSFDEWKKIFPEKTLLQTSRLCWKHFAEEDIVKGKMIGQEFVHQERRRLKKGAKPTLLLGDCESNTECGGSNLCLCSNNQQIQVQRGPAVLHDQSDQSDGNRRQNSSDVSRESSRSYGDSRPLIPLQQQQHHHHHQLSSQNQSGGGTHDLLTISYALNSPHTKHRHPSLNQFDAANIRIRRPFTWFLKRCRISAPIATADDEDETSSRT